MFTSIFAPILSNKPVTTFQSMQMVYFFSVMSLSQAIGAFTSSILLFLLLHGHIFFNLLDVIDHIHNYLINLERVELYCNVVK